MYTGMRSKKHQQQTVLAELRQHGNVTRAARATGLHRRTINHWRLNDPVFRAAAEAALCEGRG